MNPKGDVYDNWGTICHCLTIQVKKETAAAFFMLCVCFILPRTKWRSVVEEALEQILKLGSRFTLLPAPLLHPNMPSNLYVNAEDAAFAIIRFPNYLPIFVKKLSR